MPEVAGHDEHVVSMLKANMKSHAVYSVPGLGSSPWLLTRQCVSSHLQKLWTPRLKEDFPSSEISQMSLQFVGGKEGMNTQLRHKRGK